MTNIIKYLAAIIAVTFLGTSATAQECKDIAMGVDRLACYDLQFADEIPEQETDETEATVTTITNLWTSRVETSDMTDQTNVFLRVESDNYVSCGFSSRSKPILLLRCMENTTAVLITTSCHLADLQSYGNVTYRLDDRAAATQKFRESTDNSTLGLWNGGSAIPFIKNMLGHDTVLMRFTPFGDSPISPRFPIAGLDDEIAELREACGW